MIVGIISATAIIVALWISRKTLNEAIKEGRELKKFQQESLETQRGLFESQKQLVQTQEQNSKFQRLGEVLKTINTERNRAARKNIYNAYKIYHTSHYINSKNVTGSKYKAINLEELDGKEFDDIFLDPVVIGKLPSDELRVRLREDVELVRATLDHIGALFTYDLIPEGILLKEIWGVCIYCWDSLEHHISIERDVRKTMHYMNNFEDFYKRVEKYVTDKGLKRVTLN